ncbi:carbon-nitrogen hydrolase family protein [bacterium]|nr:carbon-nitrogen hydrolase family protein [bacterium]
MGDVYRIAGAQIDVKFADIPHNLKRIEEVVRETSSQGAWLTVFPEAAISGYCFETLEEALPHSEPIPGPATNRLTEICRSYDTRVIAGMLERDGDRIFNAVVLVGPDGVIGSYRKIHMPYLGVDQFATPGDRPFRVWQVGPLKIGMHICYDGSFPESARVMTLDGADLIVLPTNWPPKSECASEHLANIRAHENIVYFMAVNRVGVERGFAFIGGSKIADPSGATLAEATGTDEKIFYADIDPEIARRKRLVRVPGKHEIDRIKDRRPEMYGRLVEPVEGDK